MCVYIYRICTTLRLLSSFPERAKSKVVLPDPGGPNNNVILQTTHNIKLHFHHNASIYETGISPHLKNYYKTLLIRNSICFIHYYTNRLNSLARCIFFS